MFVRQSRIGGRLDGVTGDVPPGGAFDGGRFQVYDQGAHITDWSPYGEPVLFTSSEAVLLPGNPIRGGIPVCFPWFAAGRGGGKRPSHGFARTTPWWLGYASEDHEVTTLEWRLGPDQMRESDGYRQFNRKVEVGCTQVFGEELSIDFQVRNIDDDDLSYEIALHTYLRVGDATAITLDGLGGCDYFDKVTGTEDTQIDPLQLTGETDRIYQSVGDVTVTDPELSRRITVSKENSHQTVVWNPWKDKARELTDLADDEWRDMVCVETANVGRSAVRLQPGEIHVMRARIGVELL